MLVLDLATDAAVEGCDEFGGPAVVLEMGGELENDRTRDADALGRSVLGMGKLPVPPLKS